MKFNNVIVVSWHTDNDYVFWTLYLQIDAFYTSSISIFKNLLVFWTLYLQIDAFYTSSVSIFKTDLYFELCIYKFLCSVTCLCISDVCSKQLI